MILTIIVTYNGEEYIEDCIDSIQVQTCKTDILIVDNGSADGTCDLIKEKYPQVKLMELGSNSGFACANNAGIRYALEHGYEYVLLLNEDTVLERLLIQKLMGYADKNTAVIPKIYMNGSLSKVWYAAGQLDFDKGNAINCREDLMNEVTEVTFMTGCCMLIHTGIFSEIGMFDESYFMYYEDTDLSMRMCASQIKMVYIPDAYVWHRMQGRKTQPYYAYYMTRNRLYFLKKYSKAFRVSVGKVIVDEIIGNIFCRDIYTKNFALWHLKGVWDFITGCMGALDRPLQDKNSQIGQDYRNAEKYRIFHELSCEWLKGRAAGRSLSDWIGKKGYQTVAIYGMGVLGETLYLDLRRCGNIKIKYGLDRRDNIATEGLVIYCMENCPEPVELIIVTAVTDYAEIKNELKKKLKFSFKPISLTQLIEEMYV